MMELWKLNQIIPTFCCETFCNLIFNNSLKMKKKLLVEWVFLNQVICNNILQYIKFNISNRAGILIHVW